MAISCEAHIDDARAIVKHLQLQRFVSFIALFCGQRIGFRMRLTYPSLRRLSVDGLILVQ